MIKAKQLFAICWTTGMYRTGYLSIGEMTVWIGVFSVHRDAAFSACRYIIDEIMQRVPIWKNEYYTSGETGWVPCHTPWLSNGLSRCVRLP